MPGLYPSRCNEPALAKLLSLSGRPSLGNDHQGRICRLGSETKGRDFLLKLNFAIVQTARLSDMSPQQPYPDGLIAIGSIATKILLVHHSEREARGISLSLPLLLRQRTPLPKNFTFCVYPLHFLRRGVDSGAGFPAFTALRMAISANISGPLPSTASSSISAAICHSGR